MCVLNFYFGRFLFHIEAFLYILAWHIIVLVLVMNKMEDLQERKEELFNNDKKKKKMMILITNEGSALG